MTNETEAPADAAATEAVLRGQIRRTVAALETHESVLEERDMALTMHQVQFERANRLEAQVERVRALAEEWGYLREDDETPTRWMMWHAIRVALSEPGLSGVTEVEPGCACGGIAACLQCQDRDAALSRSADGA